MGVIFLSIREYCWFTHSSLMPHTLLHSLLSVSTQYQGETSHAASSVCMSVHTCSVCFPLPLLPEREGMGKGGGWESMRANTATEWKPKDSLNNISHGFRMEYSHSLLAITTDVKWQLMLMFFCFFLSKQHCNVVFACFVFKVSWIQCGWPLAPENRCSISVRLHGLSLVSHWPSVFPMHSLQKHQNIRLWRWEIRTSFALSDFRPAPRLLIRNVLPLKMLAVYITKWGKKLLQTFCVTYWFARYFEH